MVGIKARFGRQASCLFARHTSSSATTSGQPLGRFLPNPKLKFLEQRWEVIRFKGFRRRNKNLNVMLEHLPFSAGKSPVRLNLDASGWPADHQSASLAGAVWRLLYCIVSRPEWLFPRRTNGVVAIYCWILNCHDLTIRHLDVDMISFTAPANDPSGPFQRRDCLPGTNVP